MALRFGRPAGLLPVLPRRAIAGGDAAARRRHVTATRSIPDLVFGMPAPPYAPGDPETVGVGVMAYHGNNDERKRADEIYAAYVKNVETFVLWLLDNGRKVRLFSGTRLTPEPPARSWRNCGRRGLSLTRHG